MRWTGTCYRAHDPRWAWMPISGEGAALKGGRFNPVGVPALYLSLTVEGMFLEMGHGFGHRFDPLTVCSYHVDVADVVDLRTEETRAASGVALADMACFWAYDLAQGRDPASWRLAERMIADGAAGILAPSFANGAGPGISNLILWQWGSELPHRVEVHDPDARLPGNPASWQS